MVKHVIYIDSPYYSGANLYIYLFRILFKIYENFHPNSWNFLLNNILSSWNLFNLLFIMWFTIIDMII
jgi:Gpi18-like mannosyltransferase